ncbi:MAG: hypothetical protein N3E47_06115 [Candidatus Bathyarchaeota archaeon]|nr:hypothetical protein [Candidatus Bathyarchaeota archaeon]
MFIALITQAKYDRCHGSSAESRRSWVQIPPGPPTINYELIRAVRWTRGLVRIRTSACGAGAERLI